MNPKIPKGGAALLDLISHAEGADYETIFGHQEKHLPKPVTQTTVDEMIRGATRVDKRSGATGRYQFMPTTMKGLKAKLKLSGHEVLVPDLQDLLAYELVKDRGYYNFLQGKISLKTFGKALSQEWASFPNPETGRSFYAGDGLNASRIKWSDVEQTLLYALETDKSKPDVRPTKESTMAGKAVPAALPWYKSIVTVGSGTGLGASFAALMAAYQPGVPFTVQIGTLIGPGIAMLATMSALISRVTSNAQPITLTHGAARDIQEQADAESIAPEAWSEPPTFKMSMETQLAQGIASILNIPPQFRPLIPGIIQALNAHPVDARPTQEFPLSEQPQHSAFNGR